MKGIIIYQSKYGATKKYVGWLQGETNYDVVETKDAKIDTIKTYDCIVLAGGIYASGIAGLPFLKKHYNQLKDKHLFVLCDGASPNEKEVIAKLIAANMKDELQNIPCFYCRGAWDISKMSFVDRNLCKLLKKSLDKKAFNTYEVWEKALVETFDQVCDWCSKDQLEPLLSALSKVSK